MIIKARKILASFQWKKFSWRVKAGIIILLISWATFPFIVLTPFLDMEVKYKAIIVTALIITGNVTFYTAGFLLGSELFTRYKARMNPRNWFKKKPGTGHGNRTGESA